MDDPCVKYVKKEILSQLSPRFRALLEKTDFERVQEFRFRVGRPLAVDCGGRVYWLGEDGLPTDARFHAAAPTAEELGELLAAFCESSLYAYQRELCQGFLTIRGGHRVGVCGRCVMTDGKITNVTEISGLNLRVARAYRGCADKILPLLLRRDGTVANTVLLAPPQCGKTTVLRELSRLLSERFKVTIVDERAELAAAFKGVPQFEVGVQTDVLDRFPKAQGMMCALRALSPDVLVTDELGGDEDVGAVKNVFGAGCRLLTSMHAAEPEELSGARRAIYGMFDRALILSREAGVPFVKRVEMIGVQRAPDAALRAERTAVC